MVYNSNLKKKLRKKIQIILGHLSLKFLHMGVTSAGKGIYTKDS